METFASLLNAFNEQKKEAENLLLQDCKALWEAGEHLPMELLKRFGWSGKGNEWLENHHPFFAVYEATTQIETAFKILVQARASLVELYGHYHAGLMYDGFELSEEIAWKATHESFKYVFAASALVQAYRRFLNFGEVDKEGYDRVFSRAFPDTELMAFVQKLRNCYGHQMLLEVSPVGTVSYGDDIKVESGLTFDRVKLLALKDAWNADAKRFIERSDKLNVLEIVGKYHRMASELFEGYGSATGVIHTVGFREIARCKQAITSAGKIISLGIILQSAKQRAVDPYAHLAKHFTKNELEKIRCLPSHSREQVDYMVALRDPLGLCDDKLRAELYELFEC
ncbi:hypothetical protein [Citreimonas salinaria]|uniref:Uncharacterized protein n=1 Tax=Citreimonas salinaria TaxID=321339 RepID=A0A1H3NPI6_9RHOB|nr:hypothetical protein [Citreimonas salinaria]SDY90708.1 hypothetical protein SAMN05444340_1284 [Citreimonas salinaria]